MANTKNKKGSAKVAHPGRKANKIARYYLDVYPKRKIRHMLVNNGMTFTKAWVTRFNAWIYFVPIAKKMGFNLQEQDSTLRKEAP